MPVESNNGDVSRLEDRIEAYNRESKLRMEAFDRESKLRMEATDRKIELSYERTERMVEKISDKLDHFTAEQVTFRDEMHEMRGEMRDMRRDFRSEGMSLRFWLVGTAVTILFGVGGIIYSGKSIWASGFASGQNVPSYVAPPMK